MRAAGWAQLALAAGSLLIPKTLGWREETARLSPLTRRVFWVYAAYIFASNVAFGAVSAFAPDTLLDGSPLARMVCLFVTGWWGARLVTQIAWFHACAPKGPGYGVAEWMMTALFGVLTWVYARAGLAGP